MKRAAATLLTFGLLTTPVLAGTLEGYAPVDLAVFQSKEGPSVIGLLIDLIEAHPESLEGNPEMKIGMKPSSDGSALQVDVEMTDYLDDSVAGEKYRALARQCLAHRGAGQAIQVPARRECRRVDNEPVPVNGTD